MSAITTIFFRNRYLLTLSMLVIAVAGFSALQNLPRIEDPRLTNRNPTIITLFPGASAERVETLVTEKIEKELKEIEEILWMESTSRAGISFIALELQNYVTKRDNKQVFSKIRDKLKDLVKILPPGVQPDFDDARGAAAFTVVYAITWNDEDDSPPLGVMRRISEEFGNRLRNVPGTELVRIYGAPSEEFLVTVDAEELAALRLSNHQIAQLIAQADSKKSAGTLHSPQLNIAMEVTGELDSLQRLSSIPVQNSGNGSLVFLGDIADIRKTIQTPPTSIAITNGKRCVYVAARMDKNSRTDQWITRVEQLANDYSIYLSGPLELHKIFDQDIYTSERLGNLAGNLLAGCALVIFIIFCIMGWRSSLVVGSALPLSSAIVLFALMALGGQLHQMSIFGMIIAIGLLIDNAIVITDEVSQRIAKGHSQLKAIEGTIRHLFVPLLASTTTTILGFMPILLLSGNIGDFVSPIATSVIVALLASFFTAIAIIPALAAIFYRNSPNASWWQTGIRSQKLAKNYRNFLQFSLKYPKLIIVLSMTLPITGFIVIPQLRDQFFPSSDRNQFEIRVWMPESTAIDETLHNVQAIRQTIREIPEINNEYWLVGENFPSVYYNLLMTQDNSPFYAQGIIQVSTAQEAERVVPQLHKILNQKFPQAQIVVNLFGQGPPIAAPVLFRVYGSDPQNLRLYGEKIRKILAQHPQVLNTRASIQGGLPKLWVNVDEHKARLTGLSLNDISAQLQQNLDGNISGSVLEQLEEIPVRIRYQDEYRQNFTQIASTNLLVTGQSKWIPLSALGNLEIRPQVSGITRYNYQRCNMITAYVTSDAFPVEITKTVIQECEKLQLPHGYKIQAGGNAEEKGKAMKALVAYMPILVTLMIATIVLSFRSLTISTIIGIVALLSAGFGMLSLWLANYPLGFNPIIGTAGLIGVALNDTIVVLAALQANPKGKTDVNAIIDEVMGCTRHVLSTTLTTIGGFLPFLFFIGGSFWPPLAIVIVGGVAGATIISLLFTPCCYYLLCKQHQEPRTIS